MAAYATVDGAELAVAHLVSLGYDEHDVGIGPRDFEVVDRHPLRAGVNRWLRVGLLTGAGATAAVTVGREIGGQALVGTVLPMVAWGAISDSLPVWPSRWCPTDVTGPRRSSRHRMSSRPPATRWSWTATTTGPATGWRSGGTRRRRRRGGSSRLDVRPRPCSRARAR